MRQYRPFHLTSLPRIGKHTLTLLFFAMIGLGVLCCTRPELVGADLLEDEAAQIGFTDTLTLQCRHVTEDHVLTYSSENGRRILRSLVGKLDDPHFGRAEARAYGELFLVNASAAFLGTTIDSVVLTLRYDTLGLYGDLSQPVIAEVYRIEEELSADQDFYSDRMLMTSAQSIGAREFTPQPYDSLYIESGGDSVLVPPMVRVPLSAQFIQDMLAQDSATFQTADSFRTWIKGLEVRLANATNTMLAFKLDDAWSRVTIFYNNGTNQSQIHFGFVDGLGAGIHHIYFTHDHTGTVAQQFLDNPGLADSLLLVQGMSGIAVEVTIPGLTNLENILINKAELEFYTADLPDDDLTLYPRVTQLINGVETEDGDIDISEDVRIVLRQFQLLSPFGGALTDIDTASTDVQLYRMNVTTSLQDIYKGNTENRFYLLPYIKPNVPRRVILYGPSHPEYPARLRLTYTIVQ